MPLALYNVGAIYTALVILGIPPCTIKGVFFISSDIHIKYAQGFERVFITATETYIKT